MLTDFFVAPIDAATSAFPGWVWLGKPVPSKKAAPVGSELALKQFAGVRLKNVDHVKLARLSELLGGVSLEDFLGVIGDPIATHPASEDMALHVVPDHLVNALANLDKAGRQKVADEWASSEELETDGFSQSDSRRVVNDLAKLATKARQEGASLYFWWSL